MPPYFFEKHIPHNGLTYEAYFKKFEAKIKDFDPEKLTPEEKGLWEYRKLNFQRSLRVSKTTTVSAELKSLLDKIDQPQIWMVLTEDWCGDSAQTLPQIAKIAAVSKFVDLRILHRDEHPEIMDQYLTNGSRGIPKLIAFDNAGNELFQWGPRPAFAAKIVAEGLKEGLAKEEIYPKLHAWYAKDRGKTVDKDFVELISKLTPASLVTL